MFPKARKNQIRTRELAGETMVYDKERGKAHCLNSTAAFVWRHCDGRTSIPQLAQLLQKELGIKEAQPVVGLALEQLSSRHLLEEVLAPLSSTARVSRRDVLKKLAVAAVSIPLVMTITAKSARASSSFKGSCFTICNYSSGSFVSSTPGICAKGTCHTAPCPFAGPGKAGVSATTIVHGSCI